MPQGTSVLGSFPPAPGTHPVVAVVSVTILAKNPLFNHSKPSPCIGWALSRRWSRRWIKSNSIASRGLQYWGDSHLPGTHPGGSGSLGHFGPKSQIQSLQVVKAISMRWADRNRSTQSACTRRTSSTGETPCRRDAIQWWQCLLSPFWPKSPIQSFESVQPSPAFGAFPDQINSVIREDLQCWGDLPRDPSSGSDGLLSPFVAPNSII
jgi:hypothetical protein